MKKTLLTTLLTLALSLTSYGAPRGNGYYPDHNEVSRFVLALNQIKQLYVEKKSDKILFKQAISGLLEQLDPHSIYLDEKDLAEFDRYTNGQYVGVGMEITSEKGTPKIVAPLDDSPAKKAGLRTGDYILAVNKKTVAGLSLMKVIKKIKGKPGTTVSITVANKTDKKPKTFTMTRERIKVAHIKQRLLPDGFGYIRIGQFQENTGKQFISAIKSLKKSAGKKLNGIVIDLRSNPGGLLDSSVEVVDALIDSNLPKHKKNKKIVYTKSRIKHADFTINAKPGDILNGAPVIVLVNGGSASGSEIVAGALQDHKRGLVIGQTTFGKGSVQTLLPLTDRDAVKLTTALYYTPIGRSIQAKGIKPDILVEQLDIKKTDTDVFAFLNISEKDLQGHLENGKKSSAKKQNIKPVSPNKDYQLYQAFILLKAMALQKAQYAS
jgi:carboxyl-terminal processing protease